MARVAGALALAGLLAGASAQDFITSLTGLGGKSVGVTPVGSTGTSTMFYNSLASTDPDAVCNGASTVF